MKRCGPSIAICARYAAVILMLSGIAGALEAQQENDKIVKLEYADSLVGRIINGESVREAIGNVKFTQGSIVVTCARAKQFLASNRIELEGEVEVHDSTMRMVGDRGMYYGNDRIAEAFDRVMVEDRSTELTANYGKYYANEKKAYFRGNVTVVDSGSNLTSDELIYYRNDQHSIATGHVIITNASSGMSIYGNRFESFRQRHYNRMTEKPRVVQIDTSADGKKDTLIVTSMIMESYQDTLERLIAIDSVQITRGELAAEADSTIFLTKLDSIILLKSPFVWYTADRSQDNQVFGDSIFIKLQKRKLETVYVRGKAAAISRADSLLANRYNQMTGQEIILHFSGNKIQHIDVNRTATSLYYLFDGTKPNGINKTTGDHVIISFKDGKIDAIKVSTGVEGQYFPEKMVKHRESDYNLEGFHWREKRPGKR